MVNALRKVREDELHAISMVAADSAWPLLPFMGRETAPSTGDLRRAILAGRIWVLAVPGPIEGYIQAYTRAKEMMVDALTILARAHNTGLSHQLLTGAELMARQKRCTGIRVSVSAPIEDVITWYGHNGYDRLEHSVEADEVRNYFFKSLAIH